MPKCGTPIPRRLPRSIKPSAMQVPNVMKEVALDANHENAPINNTALHITDDNHVS
jgi:hypothetical protein